MARRHHAQFLGPTPTLPGVVGPDDQDIWKPRWKITFPEWPTGGPLRTSTIDLDSAAVPFHGLIVDEPRITRRLTGDPVYPEVESSDASFSLWNDGSMTALHNEDRLHGLVAVIERWDDVGPDYFLLTRLVGKVTWEGLEGRLCKMTASTLPLAALEEPIPKDTITTTEFPKAPEESIGETVPRIIGIKKYIRLICVCLDPEAGEFHYLIPPGVDGGVCTVNAMRSDGVGGEPFAGVHGPGDPDAEYEIRDDLYPNRRVARFLEEQRRFGGNEPHKLFADLEAAAATRNFATAYRGIVEGAWAIGGTVDAASFNAVRDHLDQLGDLFADGVIGLGGPVQAQDVLRELAMVRRLRPGLTATGAWTLAADVPRTDIKVQLSDGSGDILRNVTITKPSQRPADRDRIKTLILKGAIDLMDEISHAEGRRTVNADKGADKEIECHYIESQATLDQVADYLSKRIKRNEKTVGVKGGQELRSVVEEDLVALTSAFEGYTGDPQEVTEFADDLDEVELLLQDYGLEPYTWARGTLAPEAFVVPKVDYTKTAPFPALNLVVVDQGHTRDAQGRDLGWIEAAWDPPTSNLSASQLLWALAGDADWVATPPVYGTGHKTVRIEGLPMFTPIDLGVRTINEAGNISADPATPGEDLILAHTTADGPAPPPPVSAVIQDAGVDLAADGSASSSFAVVRVVMPNAFVTSVAVFYGVVGVAAAKVDRPASQGATVDVKVPGLTAGITIALRAEAFNGGLGSTGGPVITSFLAPGDVACPGVPSGLAVDGQKLTDVVFRCTMPADLDASVLEYEIRSAASAQDAAGAGSLLLSGSKGAGTPGGVMTFAINVSTLVFGTTYRCRARAKDATGNPKLADTTARNGTLANTSPDVTGVSTTADLAVGMPVSGTGIPGGTSILLILSATSFRMSANATTSATVSITFGARWSATIGFTPAKIDAGGGNGHINPETVGTTEIEPNAVTENSPYIDDTPTLPATGTETVVDTITVTGVTAGARVDLQVNYLANMGGATTVTVRLRKGTTVGGTLMDSFVHAASELNILLASDAAPSVGSQSYVVTLAATGTPTHSIARVRALRLLAKR